MDRLLDRLSKGDLSLPSLSIKGAEYLRRPHITDLSGDEQDSLVAELCGILERGEIKEADDASVVLSNWIASALQGGGSGSWLGSVIERAERCTDPVVLVRFLCILARVFDSGSVAMEQLIALRFPGLIFRSCQSSDIMLQILVLEMMVGLTQHPTFIVECVTPEFQNWLLSVSDISSPTVVDSIASGALRVVCSAISTSRRQGLQLTQATVSSFKGSLVHFLSSRSEPYALTGLHCLLEFICSSPKSLEEVLQSVELMEGWGSLLKSSRLTTKQACFECINTIFEDATVGINDHCTLAIYSKISEQLDKDLTERLIEICKSAPVEIQIVVLKLIQLIARRPWIFNLSSLGTVSAILEYAIKVGTGNPVIIPYLQGIIDALSANPNVGLLGQETVSRLKSTRLSRSVFANPETL